MRSRGLLRTSLYAGLTYVVFSLAVFTLVGNVASTAWRVVIVVVWVMLMLAGVARLVHDHRSSDSARQ